MQQPASKLSGCHLGKAHAAAAAAGATNLVAAQITEPDKCLILNLAVHAASPQSRVQLQFGPVTCNQATRGQMQASLGWRRQLEAERSQLGMWLRLWQQLSSKHHTGSSGLGDGRIAIWQQHHEAGTGMPAPGLKADQPHFWSTKATPAGRSGRYLKPRWARTTGLNSSCNNSQCPHCQQRRLHLPTGILQSEAAPLLACRALPLPQRRWGRRQHDAAPLPALRKAALPHLRCPGSLGAAVAAAADLGACSAVALPARLPPLA